MVQPVSILTQNHHQSAYRFDRTTAQDASDKRQQEEGVEEEKTQYRATSEEKGKCPMQKQQEGNGRVTVRPWHGQHKRRSRISSNRKQYQSSIPKSQQKFSIYTIDQLKSDQE